MHDEKYKVIIGLYEGIIGGIKWQFHFQIQN
jgi:hypothetical protein